MHTCPPGTLFDNTKSLCETASLVNCNPTGLAAGSITAGSLAVSSLSANSESVYAGSVSGVLVGKSDTSVLCPSDGHFAIMPDCKTYVQCAHTNSAHPIKYVHTCPNNLVFDNTIQNCNFPDQVICK